MSPLRQLANGDYCSDDHQRLHLSGAVPVSAGGLMRLTAVLSRIRQTEAPYEDVTEAPDQVLQTSVEEIEIAPPEVEAASTLPDLPEAPAEPERAGLLPAGDVVPLREEAEDLSFPLAVATTALAVPGAVALPACGIRPMLPDLIPSAKSTEGFWIAPTGPSNLGSPIRLWHALKHVPSDLKLMTLLVPIVLVMALHPPMRRVPVPKQQAADRAVKTAVSGNWALVKSNLSSRAGVDIADDFRSGLDAWQSRGNAVTAWSYDSLGFVRPGALALYRPSMELTDYSFDSLNEIDKGGFGMVFRAANIDNYWALKFLLSGSGPLPSLHVVRYPVLRGKEGPRVEHTINVMVRKGMLYRTQIVARGSDFTVLLNGQIVDFWSDPRLTKGGIGFFCGKGEQARLRWVEVTHQNDTLGRLCAYLAPYRLAGETGNLSK